jgi:hypothetical protein
MSIATILLILAFLSFVLAALPVPAKVNFIAVGLALWSLSAIIASGVSIG